MRLLVNQNCCDEPGEDCSQGYPTTCNSDCAQVFEPYYDNCRQLFDDIDGRILDTTIIECRTQGRPQPPARPQPPIPAPAPPNMQDPDCNIVDPSTTNFSCDSTRECRDICDNWYCDTSSGYCED